MNPALYKLPLSMFISLDGLTFKVHDADHKTIATFLDRLQAADFVAEMNKHTPKQPTRPKER